MLERHSATVVPITENSWTNFKKKLESNRIWLKLTLSLLIPLMIGVFTITSTIVQNNISLKQRNQDKQDSRDLREQSDRLADNIQKESILINYLNDISKLLISETDTKIYMHIRTKTLTSLRQLDSERKRYLLLYLYESYLLYYDYENKTSSLLQISGADLNGVQFNTTNDIKCAFVRMELYGVYLSNSLFNSCFIDRSNFSLTTMNNARFYKGLLIRVSFKFASLENTCFCHMKLVHVNFAGTNLIGSHFIGTVWDNATVDFTNANLTGAILSNIQLRNSTLDNSILPNKTWGPIQNKNLITNGDFQDNCVSRILTGWEMFEGIFQVFPGDDLTCGKCHFRVTSFNKSKTFAYIVKTIDLEDFTLLISTGNARYEALAEFQCFGVQYATMIVRHFDENGLRDKGLDNETIHGTHIQSLTISNTLKYDVRSVRIYITIFRSRNLNDTKVPIEGNYCVCYKTKFSIMKNN